MSLLAVNLKVAKHRLGRMYASWFGAPESTAPAGIEPRAVPPPRLEPLDLVLSGHPLDPFQMRCEDVRFSPSGRLLAVVTTQNRVLLFAVDTRARPVQAEYLTAFASRDIRAPHGVDWIDEETLVIANRRAGFAFFTVPRANRWEPTMKLAAISTAQPKWFGAPDETRDLRGRPIITGASSARIHDGYIYSGCNKANTITRHRILHGPSCADGELVAQEGIEIPDSALVSPDGVWLAVSDHDHHRVLIFRLGEPSPRGQLSDPRLLHPHGIAFDPGGTMLVVGDAGGRGLFAFHAPGGAWNVVQTAAAAQTAGVTKEVFERVQAETPEAVRNLEGGIKGVDMSKDGRVVVTTCRGQTIRFFALHAAR